MTDEMQPLTCAQTQTPPHDAAKNPRMTRMALGTADVKNDYKSTYGIY